MRTLNVLFLFLVILGYFLYLPCKVQVELSRENTCALFIFRNLLCHSVITEISRRKKIKWTIFNIRIVNLSSSVLFNRINFTITWQETTSLKNTILSYLRSRWLDINAKVFLQLCFIKSSGSHSDINAYSIRFCIAKQTVYIVL